MVVTLGQQYNIGEKPTVMLFFPFNVLVANPKKTILYTVANPARGLLNREKRTKEVWQHTLATPTLLVRRNIKIYKSRDASTGATQVSVGLASVQGYLRLVD